MMYKEKFGEWLAVDEVSLREDRHLQDRGHTLIVYGVRYASLARKFVAEEWDCCEFVGSSDWWEE